MSEAQVHAKLEEAILKMSAECERGIIGYRELNGIPIAGYALLAPNCVLFSQPLVPERDIFLDYCLN